MKQTFVTAALCLALTLVVSGFVFGIFLDLPMDPAMMSRLQSLLASP